jgi:hypothetical protein
MMRCNWLRVVCGTLMCALLLASSGARTASAQVVPGSGTKLTNVGDDFEEQTWTWSANRPKSSDEQDHQTRLPGGFSSNGRWYESALRGAPDSIERVETPSSGLPGSKYSLKLRTLQSGIPGQISGQPMQDDLLINVTSRVGGYISTSQTPSIVVRVYLPPFDQWEKRTGNSFGFRGGVRASEPKPRKSRRDPVEDNSYWPGMFIHFNSKSDGRTKEDSAALLIRADESGRDFWGPKITEPGWWTLGMTFTPDGAVHYYAHAGVADLQPADRLASRHPYSFHAVQFASFFFDLVNRDDGSSWSTEWIIDDPSLYVLRPR